MANFSTIYKKAFRKMLLPYGYYNWKNVFYKMEDDICIFILSKKTATPSLFTSVAFDINLDLIPYCINLRSYEYDPRKDAHHIAKFLNLMMPNYAIEKYLEEGFFVENEDILVDTFEQICKEIEEFILPHIHRYANVESLYSEYLQIRNASTNNNVYNSEFIFGLSIKLHEYDNALPYLNRQLRLINEHITYSKNILFDFERGNIDSTTLSVLKKRPDAIELKKRAAERTIAEKGKELHELEILMEALLAKDIKYLDEYIHQIEESSRIYIQQMISR